MLSTYISKLNKYKRSKIFSNIKIVRLHKLKNFKCENRLPTKGSSHSLLDICATIFFSPKIIFCKTASGHRGAPELKIDFCDFVKAFQFS